jgi:hypothetical protein
MLLVSSDGSIGMAWPAFLCCQGLANRSAGQLSEPRMPDGPTGRRRRIPDGFWVREATTVQVARGGAGTTGITVRLAPLASNRPLACRVGGHFEWLNGSCSLGLRRCGGRVVAGRLAQPPLACIDSPRLLNVSTQLRAASCPADDWLVAGLARAPARVRTAEPARASGRGEAQRLRTRPRAADHRRPYRRCPDSRSRRS